MIKQFICWLWGHKLLQTFKQDNIGPNGKTWTKTFTKRLDYCLRCGADREKV